MAECPDKKPSARHGRHGQPKPRPAGGRALVWYVASSVSTVQCCLQPLIPKVVLIAYEGFYLLVNSVYAFRVASNFRLLDAAHVPTDSSCRCAFFLLLRCRLPCHASTTLLFTLGWPAGGSSCCVVVPLVVTRLHLLQARFWQGSRCQLTVQLGHRPSLQLRQWHLLALFHWGFVTKRWLTVNVRRKPSQLAHSSPPNMPHKTGRVDGWRLPCFRSAALLCTAAAMLSNCLRTALASVGLSNAPTRARATLALTLACATL